MTDPNVVLNIPKERCKDIEINGTPFVQVDTDMTADELIIALMKWSASENKIGIVRK